MTEIKRPGGEMVSRPLHFIFLADCSGSMSYDGKMVALNNAIREALPHMKSVADENPNAQVLVRAIKFSNGAQWHISQPTEMENFNWIDLQANGGTDLGKAFELLSEQLKMPPMNDRALPPVLVLISDGQPTDDYQIGLQKVLDLPWGKKAVRISIAIGDDADTSVLEKFVNNPEIPVLQANSPEMLVKYIKWASTVVLKSASSPASQTPNSNQTGNGNIPMPNVDTNNNSADVW